MTDSKDLDKYIGQISGDLTAISLTGSKFECQCTCGTKIDVYASNFTKGLIKSCGSTCCQQRRNLEKVRAKYVGQTFGKLLVLDAEYNKNNIYLKFRCHCGNNGTARQFDVAKCIIKSCGCLFAPYPDEYYLNKKFERLTVKYIHKNDKDELIATCICDCGNEKITKACYLLNQDVKSCGCLKLESSSANGKSLKGKSYKSWNQYIGKKYNSLTVISMVDEVRYLTECDCGKRVIYSASLVVRGKVRSCADNYCIASFANSKVGPESIGKVFNNLTIISLFRKDNPIRYNETDLIASCKCICGNQKDINAYQVVSGQTKSCGCIKKNKPGTQKEGDLRQCRGRCGQFKILNDQNFPRRDGSDHLWRWECFDCRRAPPLSKEETEALLKLREEKKIWTRLHSNISRNIRYYASKNGTKKEYNTEKYLPYSMKELKAHIESLWEPWMNWENQGHYKAENWVDNDQSTWRWQIDHIKPASEFFYTKPEDPDCQACWALSNLRPISAKENWYDGVYRTRHQTKKTSSRIIPKQENILPQPITSEVMTANEVSEVIHSMYSEPELLFTEVEQPKICQVK